MRQRILMISTHGYVSGSPELGKPDTGGQVVYVLELSKTLARMGYSVDILTRRFADQPRVDRISERVSIHRIPCGGKDFIPKEVLCDHIPEWVLNALPVVSARGRRYAFVNSHYWDAGLAGQTLAQKLGIPHVHTPHSIGAWKRENMDGDPAELERAYNFQRRIRDERAIYRECDALVATTTQQRDILTGTHYGVPPGKIQVIPPGYDDTRFFPVSNATCEALRREHGHSGRVILALGRIARNKGYDLLIQAMPPVFQRIPDARLVLAIGSTNPTEEERAQLAELHALARELHIEDRVVFGDYIPDDLLPDYYRLADVFVLSSRYEPFGMTAVESMACGTPTVVTTEGGLWEQLIWGLEAVYANPFDTEAFGHAICAVLQYPRVAAQTSRYGSQKARARFTWTGVAQQIVTLAQGLPVSALSGDELAGGQRLPIEKSWREESSSSPT